MKTYYKPETIIFCSGFAWYLTNQALNDYEVIFRNARMTRNMIPMLTDISYRYLKKINTK